MHHIFTCRVECWMPDSEEKHPVNYTAEWLRNAVCSNLKKWGKDFEKENIDTALFHNHAPGKNDPEIRYPLIIYHCTGTTFYITGINEGATALAKLSELFKKEGITNRGYLLHFTDHSDENFSLGVIPELRQYSLRYWLPVTPKESRPFTAMPLVQKAAFLEQKLNMHLTADLCKHLKAEVEGLKALLTDISFVYPEPVIFKAHPFRAFDIVFSANLALPGFIGLGNIKSLGYGRVEPF